MENRIFIISPQAGFGNRLRTIASSFVLGKYLNRQVKVYWPKHDPHPYDLPHIAKLKKKGFKDFFGDTHCIDELPKIKRCYTEWLPGEFWYDRQSLASKQVETNIKIGSNCDMLHFDTNDVVLVESSLSLTLSFIKDYESEIRKAYKNLEPCVMISNILRQIPNYDVGVSIRRGEFYYYFPESKQDETQLIEWLKRLIETNNSSVVLFSDDHNYRENIKQLLGTKDFVRDSLDQENQAFIEFLVLSKCKIIYGTPKSSFAEEAARYGDTQYKITLS